MKTLFTLVLCTLVLACALVAPALALDQDFVLVNSTGVVIEKIFVSPHDADKWGDDIMGQDVLADGESLEVKFHRDEAAAEWDLKIEDREGNTIEWEKLSLPTINKITLDYDDKKPSATVE